MKNKMIFGIFALALMVINISQSIKIENKGFSMFGLITTAAADPEGEGKYINYANWDEGYCDVCIYHLQNTCRCTYYHIYCYSGGDQRCDFDEHIGSPYDCKTDGGFCYM